MTNETTKEIKSNSLEERGTTEANPAVESGGPEPPATRGDAKSKEPQPFGPKSVGVLLLIPVLLFVIVLAGHRSHRAVPGKKPGGAAQTNASAGQQNQNTDANAHSGTPITNLDGHNAQLVSDGGGISPEEMGRTAHHDSQEKSQTGSGNTPSSLGEVADFNQQGWQPPAYPGATETDSSADIEKGDKLDKPSLVFVHNTNSGQKVPGNEGQEAEIGLGLPTGTRLRAHLEAVATTAVNIPVIAVIDYNYEHDGAVLIPAGAKALGRVDQADRTGYMSIQFDSLLMPDGSTVSIRGVATDLSLRPLKGKVEGTHSGRNIFVRTITGIGQTGAMLVGGNSNQPVSQADMMRTQVANNMGQVSDEEIQKSTVAQRVVVSVPARTSIYVILEKSSGQGQRSNGNNAAAAKNGTQANMDELKELLELQRAMSQAPAAQP